MRLLCHTGHCRCLQIKYWRCSVGVFTCFCHKLGLFLLTSVYRKKSISYDVKLPTNLGLPFSTRAQKESPHHCTTDGRGTRRLGLSLQRNVPTHPIFPSTAPLPTVFLCFVWCFCVSGFRQLFPVFLAHRSFGHRLRKRHTETTHEPGGDRLQRSPHLLAVCGEARCGPAFVPS